jgi:hypothetical protein
MEDHWLYPLKGGTGKERLIALYYFALLGSGGHLCSGLGPGSLLLIGGNLMSVNRAPSLGTGFIP